MNYGIKQQDILALSPYQAQCKHIHSKLQANKLNGVRCTTVKSSEGIYLCTYPVHLKTTHKYVYCNHLFICVQKTFACL